MIEMDYHALSLGKNAPETFRAVVEIPKESRNKYEIHEGLLQLDRVLHSPLSYPTNYGFIPRTKAKDGDALDVLVWSRFPLNPCCVVHVRPLGMLKMRDEEGIDNKILAVPRKDPFFKYAEGVHDVQESLLNEMAQFFRRYKELEEDKITEVEGWFGREEAKKVIMEGTERYRNATEASQE